MGSLLMVPPEERFFGWLPAHAWPLPAPGPDWPEPPAWWDHALDHVAPLPHLTIAQARHQQPDVRARLRNLIVRSMWSEITTKARHMVMFARYEDETNFGRLQRELAESIGVARSRDWPRHIVSEYRDEYARCARLCDADRRGYSAPDGEPLSWGPANVQAVMECDADIVFMGVVHYGHLHQMLLTEASHG